MTKEKSDAIVYDAVRTPRGKGRKSGSLHSVRPTLLAREVLQAIAKRNHLDTQYVDDVILGCVTQVAEQGANVAKTAASFAGYHDSVAGLTINRFCASGLSAINQAAANIIAGYGNLFVSGGVESMSRIPMASDGGAWAADPEIATVTGFVPQGISADLIATLENFSRKDADEYAVESQKRAVQAWEEHRFDKSIVPVKGPNGNVLLAKDEHPRPGTTVDDLAKLNPAFEEIGTQYGFDSVALQKYPEVEKIHHIHHAGNSSGIVDGAAAVLLGNLEIGKKLGFKPRARIRTMALVSTEPTIMLTGPIPATQKALAQSGLSVGDIDLFEVNEAFASVVLKFMKDLKVPHAKVNVNGGAIAMGHPLGATGAMITGTLIDELERQDKTLGLVTLCVGGGMGVATIFERI